MMFPLGIFIRLVQPLVWHVSDLHPPEHSLLGHADRPVLVAVAPNYTAAWATDIA